MEMENEDKRPVVWVARRLMRRSCGCDAHPIAYFVSKARVQSITRRFLKNGQEVKEYEVEYETPQALEEISYDSDIYAETGEWVKADRVFRNFLTAINYRDFLNQRLVAKMIAKAPASMVDEIISDMHRDSRVARELEKHFDNIFILDNREF